MSRPAVLPFLARTAAVALLAAGLPACEANDTLPTDVDPQTVLKQSEPTKPTACKADSECAKPANPCEAAACVAGVCGSKAIADGGKCEDGNKCSADDTCKAGACVAGATKKCEDNDVCTKDACDPKSGFCTYSPVPTQCNDNNPCTDDGCQKDKGCIHTDVALGFCDDGNVCTISDACAKGKCVAGVTKVCDDGNPCTTDTCDAVEGCQSNPGKGACDDGNKCTANDFCLNGECKQGPDALGCNDKNPCTVDSCEPKKGCVNASAPQNQKLCDDGDACTIGEACQGGACKGGLAKPCDDQNPCTNDLCDSKTGCTSKDNLAGCDDGNKCTENDLCVLGACKAGSAKVCDDKNPCTADSCDPLAGCQLANSVSACDDANACTVGDVCKEGNCTSGKPQACDDGNACTDDACDPKNGCTKTNNSKACDDGSVCSESDTCKDGACVAGKAKVCDDGNVCTKDTCDAKAGCGVMPESAGCDDGNKCTEGELCINKACGDGSKTVCDDKNPCTDDSCDPTKGCVFANNTATCDDGKADTTNDKCAGGMCMGTPSAPTCAAYCTAVMAACTGANQQYKDAAACLTFCSDAKLAAGKAGDKDGNTIGCRAYHASVAAQSQAAADAHCVHTGPTGGNICGAWCDNYCELVQKVCNGQNAQYKDDSACKTACAKTATTGKATDTSGASLQCMTYHAGVAASTPDAAKAHCPHTLSPNKAGDPCAAAGKEYTVTTNGFAFDPPDLTVSVGDTVKFTPAGNHNVVEVSESDWMADKFTPKVGGFSTGFGEAKVWKVEAVGGMYYMCAPHSPDMKGKITVK
jgi:plastocyanin